MPTKTSFSIVVVSLLFSLFLSLILPICACVCVCAYVDMDLDRAIMVGGSSASNGCISDSDRISKIKKKMNLFHHFLFDSSQLSKLDFIV